SILFPIPSLSTLGKFLCKKFHNKYVSFIKVITCGTLRGGGNIHRHMTYKDIISTENLLKAWQEFVKGKKNKKDVSEFSVNLLDNIFNLHRDLRNKIYKHSNYEHFKISDPKPRDIHKASVRDRLLHH